MLRVPRFLIPRPQMPTDPTLLAAFDALFDKAVAQGLDRPVAYDLPAPRWQFICHIADTREVVLHGSSDPAIGLFEPRKSNDAIAFGNRTAVYAASDGLWPMYFAILDRTNHNLSLVNAAVRFETAEGLSAPHYFFSITRDALIDRPYRDGTVYFLPRSTFEPMPAQRYGDVDIHVPQWASLVPVAPMAKIAVAPEDFPLLDRLRGHDDAVIARRAAADPSGFPWLDD
jgi:hypothetical protein